MSAEAQAALAIRTQLASALAACRATTAGLPALGCGLTYFGLDRNASPPALRPAVPSLPAGAQPGDQWQASMTQTTSEGATVDFVDPFTCTTDGASKVGRTAVQTNADGSTDQWGERDYVGTLWPKMIAPGATWSWQAVQYVGAEDQGEQWTVQVQDAGRETLRLPQGTFQAIRLHLEEDIVQSDGQTQHVAWDEWYAQPRSS